MNTPNHKYLHIVRLSQMQGWSVSRHLKRCFAYTDRYPMVAIGEFLRQSRDETVVQDEETYKQLTVKTRGGGVCLRATRCGKDIGTKRQWRARAGQFVLSKIDARNGAMGIVTAELDGAIVTHDFPLFDVDGTKINPQFLLLITTTAPFQQFAQSCSSGTTNRQRINVEKFLCQRIPLPPIKEQNLMVERYNDIIGKAEEREAAIADTHGRTNAFLEKELDLEVDVPTRHKGMAFVRFKDITRWDYLYYCARKQFKSRYDLVAIGSLIKCFLADGSGNSLRRNTSDTPLRQFTYIGMEHIEKDTGRLLETRNVEGSKIKSQSLQVPKGFILYGKLRPYLNKYWVNGTDLDNIVCSSEFFVFDISTDKILKDYFACLLASDFVQRQISDTTSGARMPRISERTFMGIKIPLPPLSVQQEIVAHVKAEQKKAEAMRAEASALRAQAVADFERSIFAPATAADPI